MFFFADQREQFQILSFNIQQSVSKLCPVVGQLSGHIVRIRVCNVQIIMCMARSRLWKIICKNSQILNRLFSLRWLEKFINTQEMISVSTSISTRRVVLVISSCMCKVNVIRKR